MAISISIDLYLIDFALQVDRDDDKADLGDSNYDEFSGYSGSGALVDGSDQKLALHLPRATRPYAAWIYKNLLTSTWYLCGFS